MRQGSFGWHELTAPDPEAALKYYAAVVGWSVRPGGPDYSVLQVDGYGVGGITPPAGARGAEPGWLGYVAVDDVDAAAGRVVALGGTVHSEPADVHGTVRLAAVADPQGARFVLFKVMSPETADMPQRPAPETQGMFGWAELLTSDVEAAFGFYSALLGWTRSFSFSLGPLGVYQVFAHEGREIGGIMRKAAEVPAAGWGFYVRVDSVSDAVSRLQAAGGAVFMPSHEAPGGRWAVPTRDPDGAVLGLISARP